MADRFLSVREAADYLGVSKSLAYRSIDEGTWPTEVVRVGARKLIPAAALYALAGETDPQPERGAA